jgi:hypothetical protein
MNALLFPCIKGNLLVLLTSTFLSGFRRNRYPAPAGTTATCPGRFSPPGKKDGLQDQGRRTAPGSHPANKRNSRKDLARRPTILFASVKNRARPYAARSRRQNTKKYLQIVESQ